MGAGNNPPPSVTLPKVIPVGAGEGDICSITGAGVASAPLVLKFTFIYFIFSVLVFVGVARKNV